MTEQSTTNPYARLLAQTKAMIRAEERMGPEDREACSWMSTIEFCGTRCTVIKGGANTFLLQLGESRDSPCFPDECTRRLVVLRSQSHYAYVIVRGDKRRLFHRRTDVLRVRPRQGDRIFV